MDHGNDITRGPSPVDAQIAEGFPPPGFHRKRLLSVYFPKTKDNIVPYRGWVEGRINKSTNLPETSAIGPENVDSEGTLRPCGGLREQLWTRKYPSGASEFGVTLPGAFWT